MFENWFDQINVYLHAHPHLITQLAFLFRLKCWLLTALMGYFVFLIYKDQKGRAKPVLNAKSSPYHFVA